MALGFYVYNECYCSIIGGGTELVHVDSIPPSCLVLNTPEAWQSNDSEIQDRHEPALPTVLANGDVVHHRDILDNYEIRSSTSNPELLFIALRSTSAAEHSVTEAAVRNSSNRFAVEVSFEGGPHRSIRAASEEEWIGAMPLDFRITGEPASPTEIVPAEVISKPAVHVSMWGGRPGSRDYLTNLLEWRYPRTGASIAIYQSGVKTAEAVFWSCYDFWDLIRDSAIHGDRFLSMPLSEDERRLLVCAIGSRR